MAEFRFTRNYVSPKLRKLIYTAQDEGGPQTFPKINDEIIL